MILSLSLDVIPHPWVRDVVIARVSWVHTKHRLLAEDNWLSNHWLLKLTLSQIRLFKSLIISQNWLFKMEIVFHNGLLRDMRNSIF